MAYKSLHKNIIFIEGHEDYIKSLGAVTYKREHFYNSQLKDLDNVKEQLANKAAAMGGNAIINFKYGQKHLSYFRAALLSLDDNINWYGEGQVVVLGEEKYKAILEAIKNN